MPVRFLFYSLVCWAFLPAAVSAGPLIDLLPRNTKGIQANGTAQPPKISADGRYVAFSSTAKNLIPGRSGTNIYLFDRLTGTLTSETAENVEPSSKIDLSRSGRYLVFTGYHGGSLVPQIILRDIENQIDRALTQSAASLFEALNTQPTLSADGAVVAFTSTDQSLLGTQDVVPSFIAAWRASANQALAITQTVTGGQVSFVSPLVSGSGRYIVYNRIDNAVLDPTPGNARTQLFRYDFDTNVSIPLLPGANDSSFSGGISDDGRFVSFTSWATNLVAGDTNGVMDCFVLDVETGQISRMSNKDDGSQGTVQTFECGISPDGQFVITSRSGNAYEADPNLASGLYRVRRDTGIPELVSVSYNPSEEGQEQLQGTGGAASNDGRIVAFLTSVPLLSSDTVENVPDYYYDLNADVYAAQFGPAPAAPKVRAKGGKAQSTIPKKASGARRVIQRRYLKVGLAFKNAAPKKNVAAFKCGPAASYGYTYYFERDGAVLQSAEKLVRQSRGCP